TNDPRFVTRVLQNESVLVRVRAASIGRPAATGFVSPPTIPPQPNWQLADGGSDGVNRQDADIEGSESSKTGIYALKKADLFNLLCIPPKNRDEATSATLYQKALSLCVERRAMLVVDPDPQWGVPEANAVSDAIAGRGALGLNGAVARNA